ncbi:MAG: carboxy terminal-processing peptidase [Verrucomicrobiae bacterium]|nr:carboxy terminal-processing peptidase [Verrucomicrobiae bacterium]
MKKFCSAGAGWRGIWGCLIFLSAVAGARGVDLSNTDCSRIVSIACKTLVKENYTRQAVKGDVSRRCLKNYLDALDGNHLFFMQGDVAGFEKKFGDLAEQMRDGRVQPAFEMFDACFRRKEQCVRMAQRFLGEEVSFLDQESAPRRRERQPRAADETEWKEMWRRQIKAELLDECLNGASVADARRILSARYERFQVEMKEEDVETILRLYLNSLGHAFDPHSEFMPPSEIEALASGGGKSSVVGVGMALGPDNGYPKVTEVVAGGVADRDGRLRVGDRIAAVGQAEGAMADVVFAKIPAVSKLVRGPRQSQVFFSVWPAMAFDPALRLQMSLRRDEVLLSEVEARGRIYEGADAAGRNRRFGYIHLPVFYMDLSDDVNGKNVSRDVRRLVERFQKEQVEGMVIDLRGNKGGSLTEGFKVSAIFTGPGPVAQVKDVSGQVQVMQAEGPDVRYYGPVVVLMDRVSASASEVMAAALQDYGAALIMGDAASYGKGTIQKLQDLNLRLKQEKIRMDKAGALKNTIQKLYRVTGDSTQGKGVVSDIAMPNVRDVCGMGEADFDNAIPCDRISEAVFTPAKRVTPHLEKLRAASAQRQAADSRFSALRAEAAFLRENAGTERISLNRAERERVLKMYMTGREAWTKEAASSSRVMWKAVELGLPGIPPTSRNYASQAALDEALNVLRDWADAASK